jgi:hypothetical protein
MNDTDNIIYIGLPSIIIINIICIIYICCLSIHDVVGSFERNTYEIRQGGSSSHNDEEVV